MWARNILRFTLLALAIIMAVKCQEEPPTEQPGSDDSPRPGPLDAPPGGSIPSFGLCKKHTECQEPNACFEETINNKKFKICVTREFHALSAAVKKKLKYPEHLA